MKPKYRAALIGFGNIAYGYESNTKYCDEFPIPTHFSALSNSNEIILDTVVDPSEEALRIAIKEPSIKHIGKTTDAIPNRELVDILIITCPPIVNKLELIKSFPALKGLILEKPLGKNLNETMKIASYVAQKNIKTQVCYLRRFDDYVISLLGGKLKKLIGSPQSAQIIYGNGLMNNASHLLDLSRMLFGEFQVVKSALKANIVTAVLQDDLNVCCTLQTHSGVNVSVLPIDFEFYRENSLDVWGTSGRLVFNQEGSYFTSWEVVNSRFGDIYKEINWSDPTKTGKTEIGYSMKKMYQNLVLSIGSREEELSPLSSAIETEKLVQDILSKVQK